MCVVVIDFYAEVNEWNDKDINEEAWTNLTALEIEVEC